MLDFLTVEDHEIARKYINRNLYICNRYWRRWCQTSECQGPLRR